MNPCARHTDAGWVSALRYNVTPVVEGEASDFPLSPEPFTAEEVATAILGRLKAMETQGYWRDNSGLRVPLTEVSYIITVAEPELTEADHELLRKLSGDEGIRSGGES